MLDKVELPGGTKLRYEYKGVHPVRRYRYHTLTGEYQWSQQGRLVKYHDHDLRLEYSFTYAADGALDTVTLRSSTRGQEHEQGVNWAAVSADWRHSMAADKAREAVEEFLDSYVQSFQPLTLRCGCNQVGSVRVLLGPRGDVVKEIVYDSFGQRLSDSFPELYIPLGFACGLHDPDTHLVRFGWRDYDPSVERFTAPDPAKDIRGDGDLYDYCADDPVSRIDPTGLAWVPPDEEEEDAETLPPLRLSDLIEGAIKGAVVNGGRAYYSTADKKLQIPATIAGGAVGAADGMFKEVLGETPAGKQMRRYFKTHRRRADLYSEDAE